jgi:transposase-like protein
MLNIDNLFKGRHFDRDVIIVCVRWYLRDKLSFRDLVEMMAERGICLAHTTIMHRIKKGQFKLSKIHDKGETAPEICNAVLAA